MPWTECMMTAFVMVESANVMADTYDSRCVYFQASIETINHITFFANENVLRPLLSVPFLFIQMIIQQWGEEI